MSQDREHSARKRKKSAAFRKALLILLILFATLVLLGALAPTILSFDYFKEIAVEKANGALAGKARIEIESWSLGWFTGVRLTNLTVKDAEEANLFKASSIKSSPGWLSLVSDKKNFGTVKIENPLVRYTSSVKPPIGRPPEEKRPREKGPGERALGFDVAAEIIIENGAAEIIEAETGRKTSFENIGASVSITSLDEAIPFSLKLDTGKDLGKGHLEADGNILAPGLDFSRVRGSLAAKATNINLRALDAVLAPRGLSMRGFANYDGNIDLKDTSAAGADGVLKVENLLITGKAVNGDKITPKDVAFLFRVGLQEDLVDFQELSLDCDIFSASATGKLSRKTLSKLVTGDIAAIPDSIFKFGANVDVAKLASQMPRTLRLLKGLKITGGKLSLSGEVGKARGKLFLKQKLIVGGVEGVREGRLYALSEPVEIDALLTRTGQELEIPKLSFASSFATFSARGTLKKIVAAGRFDLEKLFSELSQFVDFGAYEFAGIGKSSIEIAESEKNVFTINALGAMENFKFKGLGPEVLSEPKASFSAHIIMGLKDKDQHNLEIKEASWTSSQMKLYAKAQVADFDSDRRKIRRFSGSLETELSYLSAFAGGLLPEGMRMAGRLSWKGEVVPKRDTLAFFQKLTIDGFDFSHPDIGERKVFFKTGTLDLETDGILARGPHGYSLIFEKAKIATDSFDGDVAGKIDIKKASPLESVEAKLSIKNASVDFTRLAASSAGVLPENLSVLGRAAMKGDIELKQDAGKLRNIVLDSVISTDGIRLKRKSDDKIFLQQDFTYDIKARSEFNDASSTHTFERLILSWRDGRELLRMKGGRNYVRIGDSLEARMACSLDGRLERIIPIVSLYLPAIADIEASGAVLADLDIAVEGKDLIDVGVDSKLRDFSFYKKGLTASALKEAQADISSVLSYNGKKKDLRLTSASVKTDYYSARGEAFFENMGETPAPRDMKISLSVQDMSRLLLTYRPLLPEKAGEVSAGGSVEGTLTYSTVGAYNHIAGELMLTNASVPISNKDGEKIDFRAEKVPVSFSLKRSRSRTTVEKAEAGPENLKASLEKGFTLDDKGDLEGGLILEYALPEALDYFPGLKMPEDFEIAGRKRARFLLKSQPSGLKAASSLLDLFAEGQLGVDRIVYDGLTMEDVQPAFTLEGGVLKIHPFTSKLNDGHANFLGSISLEERPFALAMDEEITAVQEVTFEKQLASRFLKFFNPIFADAGVINGKVDVVLKSLYVPLAGNFREGLRAEGVLKIKDLQLKSSPFLNLILKTIDKGATVTALDKISDTRFTIKNGKVYYDNMVIISGTHELSFSGSVDLKEQKPDLLVRIPMTKFLVPGKDAFDLLKDETIIVPIRGTLNAPKLAFDVLRTNVNNLIKGIMPRLLMKRLLQRREEKEEEQEGGVGEENPVENQKDETPE